MEIFILISLIAAFSINGVIGMDEKIPWYIPGEQKRFRELTIGKTIVMGRKTYESIGKPLPQRNTVVISKNYRFEEPNCVTVPSIEAALSILRNEHEIFIAGGGQIYQETISYADKLYLTVIEQHFEGNIYFPNFEKKLYNITFTERHTGEVPFTYYTYERNK